jgi:hypothetical protein
LPRKSNTSLLNLIHFLIYRREEAIENGIKNAIKVPLSLAQIISKLWSNIRELANVIHYPTKSDLQVFNFRANALQFYICSFLWFKLYFNHLFFEY